MGGLRSRSSQKGNGWVEMGAVLQRYRELLTEEADLPVKQIWCSMADPNLPEGTQFLGAVCVHAQGVASATRELNTHGLNLGGEIMFTEIPAGDKRIPTEWMYRVMNKEEALNCPCEVVGELKEQS